MNRTSKVQAVYRELLDAWNNRNARGMADLFVDDGVSIGFDGSESIGNEEIFMHLKPIFEDHPTARFINKIKDVQILNSDVAILRAIAGMIPPNKSDINPKVNTHHTLVVVKHEGEWHIKLFQNTPAQFHGRPELVEQMSEELRELLN